MMHSLLGPSGALLNDAQPSGACRTMHSFAERFCTAFWGLLEACLPIHSLLGPARGDAQPSGAFWRLAYRCTAFLGSAFWGLLGAYLLPGAFWGLPTDAQSSGAFWGLLRMLPMHSLLGLAGGMWGLLRMLEAYGAC